MQHRDPRSATGTQPAEPATVHPHPSLSAVVDDRVEDFVSAWTDRTDPSLDERAGAVRLLIDMLVAQYRAIGSPEVSPRGRAIYRRVLGSALDLDVLTDDDVEWAQELTDVAVIRRRVRPGFAPMGLRCALLAEGRSSVLAVVRGRVREDDFLFCAPLDEYAVERAS